MYCILHPTLYKTFDKVLGNGAECSKLQSVTVYEYKLLFSDVGDDSLKAWNPVTVNGALIQQNGKGTRNGKTKPISSRCVIGGHVLISCELAHQTNFMPM